jgi:predicted dehydrogenase
MRTMSTPSLLAETDDRDALRVAVFGLGRDGLALAATAAMRPEGTLVGLGDPRPMALRRALGVGFAVPGHSGLERLIDEVSPQALVLAVPTRERAAAVRRAIDAGIATLVAPPLAVTHEEAAALTAHASQRGVPLAVAHRLAFEPAFVHASLELDAKALGTVRLARSSMYWSRVFSTREARVLATEAPGGVLAGPALDLLVVLEALFGPPVTVRAHASRLYGGDEDEAHVMMTTGSGAEVGLDASWSVPGYPAPAAVIEAEGSNGVMLVSDDAYEAELNVAHAPFPAGHRRLQAAELTPGASFDLEGESRDPMVGAFLDWARGGPEPPHAAVHAVRAQRTLDALHASIRRGGTEVRVGAA